MRREPVESSTISSVGYSQETSTLELEFLGGNVYRYFAVPVAIYAALMKAESKGSFFQQAIRTAYPCARL